MKKVNYFILIAFSFFACKKVEIDAPAINDIYAPVVVTQAFSKTLPNPNFSVNDKEVFTAEFAQKTVWTITLTGQTSHAVKTIKGVSKTLDASNAVWEGYADTPPSFIAENVTAMLTFDNYLQDTFTTTLTIATPNNLDAGNVLVSNFQVSKRYCCGFPIPNGWPSDYPNITNIDATTGYDFPDGNHFMLMSGIPWPNPQISPYVNYMTIAANSADVNYGSYYAPLNGDPTTVYFNIMVHGEDNPDVWFQINISEEGGASKTITIKPKWKGWRLLSYRYSDLAGNTPGVVAKSNKITAVQFVLLSNTATLPGDEVRIAFDHPIFTNNAPYQP